MTLIYDERSRLSSCCIAVAQHGLEGDHNYSAYVGVGTNHALHGVPHYSVHFHETHCSFKVLASGYLLPSSDVRAERLWWFRLAKVLEEKNPAYRRATAMSQAKAFKQWLEQQ